MPYAYYFTRAIPTVNMLDCNNQGFTCGSCDRDYTVTSSSTVEVDSYDVLLTELLSVQDFLKSNVFPPIFNARFDILLDKLSASGRRLPYVPPSTELIQAVHKFVGLMKANESLLCGIVRSTRSGLFDLSSSCR